MRWVWLLTLALLGSGTKDVAAQSAPVVYNQHWRTGDSRDPYAEGTIEAPSIVGQTAPAPLVFSLRMDANPRSPSRDEWELGRDSLWDIVTGTAGTFNPAARQKRPDQFSDNPGGYLEVAFSITLENTNGIDSRIEFEIYGTTTGLNVSPPSPREQAMLVIPGSVVWRTKANGEIEHCEVSYGTIQQASRISSSGGNYPRRKCPPRTNFSVSDAEGLEVESIDDAETKFFGEFSDEAHTSHFNLDNRVFMGDPNPPTTEKRRCMVECQLDDGTTRFLSSGELRRIPVDDWRVLDVNEQSIRVVRCRFWWRLSPHGERHSSEWIEADPDHFIKYVFLVWKGQNEYVIEQLTQEPLPVP